MPYRCRVMRRIHDDAGAVAVLVALSISTFLLGFAALAVDFGQVYTRKDAMTGIAELAAMAGAAELPDADAARAAALATMCTPENALPEWTDGSVCPAYDPDDDVDDREAAWEGAEFDGTAFAWASNGDLSDGEIVIYGRDADDDGRYEDAERLGPGAAADAARAIRVVLPESVVEFGLAKTFGADSLTVTKAATAQVTTPVGMGIFPFAARIQDIENHDGRFCIRDPNESGSTSTANPEPPAGNPSVYINMDDTVYAGQPAGIRPHISSPRNFPVTTDPPRVFFRRAGGYTESVPAETWTSTRITFIAPDLAAGTYTVWVEWQTASGLVRSGHPYFDALRETVRVERVAGTPANPCYRPDAERGVLDIGRREISGSPANANDILALNVSDGFQPVPHRYDEYPALLNPILDPLLNLLGLQCTNVLGLAPLLSALNVYSQHINCATTRPKGFADGLTRGLFNSTDGRLKQRCSSATANAGSYGQIDGTDLFSSSSPLINASVAQNRPLATAIADGVVERGWINGKAFRCPRLGLVPITNPDVPAQAEDNPFIDFTYAWIEDDAAGLAFGTGNPPRLQSVRAYAVDPGYFPEVVAESPKVTEYLGDGFPKQAQLVPDVSDP